VIALIENPAIFIEKFRPLNDDITNLINNSLNFSWLMVFIIIIFYTICIKKLSSIRTN
jgi:hypothetical protein